jgi:outer membrane protein assembly factor BamB
MPPTHLFSLLFTALALLQAPQSPSSPAEELWEAARAGDRARVERALAAGADVNAKARYDMTALAFAADKGHLDVIRLLAERGADLDVQDTFYKFRALDLALGKRHFDIAIYLLSRGARGAGNALSAGVRAKHVDLVKAALAGADLERRAIDSALALANRQGDAAIIALVKAAADARPADAAPAVRVDPKVLATYAGTYRNDNLTIAVSLKDMQLVAQASGQPALTLVPLSETMFRAAEVEGITLSFAGRGGTIERVMVAQGSNTFGLERVSASASAAPPPAAAPAAAAPVPPEALAVKPRGPARPWPSFRGENASGNGDGQGAVVEWDVATGKNVRWKVDIPGIATSSPIVTGGRVFLTTAVSKTGDTTFRTGLYGDVDPVEDLSEHTWKMYAVDARTGTVVWEREIFTGAPRVKRHTKSSQANSTPVTDGRRVVAVFGTIGLLVCYDVDGTLLWKKDLGVVDNGWFLDPTYQWGHSSSPVVYDGLVILQADQQKGSYLAAFDIATGAERWRTARDEISTWGTPTILKGEGRDELVTNGTKVRGYDPKTGTLLWTLGPNSEITVGTPVTGAGLVFVTGGYPPVRPVYAIRPGGSGDLTLPKGETASQSVAWSNDREGTYIPTPIVYGEYLYTCNLNGILTAYKAATGERVYRARVGGGGAFSASPIAADGRLYFAGEDGDVFVVQAGPAYVELAKNSMKEAIMATPAISDGTIFVRTLGKLYAIGAADATQ